MNDTDCTPASAAELPNFTETTFSRRLDVGWGVMADLATVTGASPALMMICVGADTADAFPARSEITEVKVHVPLAMELIWQKLTVGEAVNEHEEFSDLVLRPLIVAISPLATSGTEMRGVATSDVVAPLSWALNGAALGTGATVSITATNGGVEFDELFA
jgi:hypothetical protein